MHQCFHIWGGLEPQDFLRRRLRTWNSSRCSAANCWQWCVHLSSGRNLNLINSVAWEFSNKKWVSLKKLKLLHITDEWASLKSKKKFHVGKAIKTLPMNEVIVYWFNLVQFQTGLLKKQAWFSFLITAALDMFLEEYYLLLEQDRVDL